MAEHVTQMQCSNKCFCDRQCLITKCGKPQIVKKARVDVEPETEGGCDVDTNNIESS